jgi:hypothetical protein
VGFCCTHHSTAAHPFARWSYICPPTIAPTADDTAETGISSLCSAKRMCSFAHRTQCSLLQTDGSRSFPPTPDQLGPTACNQFRPTVTLAAMVISNPTGAIAQLKNRSKHHIISRHASQNQAIIGTSVPGDVLTGEGEEDDEPR